jgi:hypothetical protein
MNVKENRDAVQPEPQFWQLKSVGNADKASKMRSANWEEETEIERGYFLTTEVPSD